MRNNNQIGGSRAVIDVVAGKVQELGDDGHKVDLKGYEKLVLVEVYRNVVGMGVLEVGGAEEWEGGLRRGNLGEVWSEGRRRLDEGRKEENKGRGEGRHWEGRDGGGDRERCERERERALESFCAGIEQHREAGNRHFYLAWIKVY